jgi:uncharacterized protein YegL
VSRPVLVPFYLVVDVSQSMDGPRLTRVNQILRKLSAALATDAQANDRVRICMIDFAGDARVVLPLCDLLNTATLPILGTRDDGTRYAPALDLLLKTINRDSRQLAADGFAVGRPGVFYLSDGEPYDEAPGEWTRAFARLLAECDATPTVIPCAIAESDPEIMRGLASPRATAPVFIQSRDARPEDAINGLIDIMIQSILTSGRQETVIITDTDIHDLVTWIAEPPEEWITGERRS